LNSIISTFISTLFHGLHTPIWTDAADMTALAGMFWAPKSLKAVFFTNSLKGLTRAHSWNVV